MRCCDDLIGCRVRATHRHPLECFRREVEAGRDVGDQHPVVVAIERAARLGGGRLDRRNTFGDVPRRGEAGEPAVGETAGAAKLGRCLPTEPDLERLLDRLGEHTSADHREAVAFVVDDIFFPEPTHEGQGLVQPRGPVLAVDLERLVLGGVGDTEPECRKAAAATDDIEACQHLGHQDRVAARYHRDGRAEFQVLAAAGDVGHRHDRIELHRIDALGGPQAVEAETVEVVDDGTESGEFSPSPWVETRDGSEGVTDAHLHAQTMAHLAGADRISLCPRHR